MWTRAASATIVNDGSIIARGFAIAVNAANVSITNTGMVSGRVAIDLPFAGSAEGFTLDELRHVERLGGGDSEASAGSGNISIMNAGSIISTGTSATASAIELHPGFHTIVNTGLISAAAGRPALDLDLATVQLTNGGTINGTVLMGTGSDYLANSGTILGSIYMGEGNNYYDGAAGTAPASVQTGSGIDILLGGAGNDTLDKRRWRGPQQRRRRQ